MDKVYYKFKEWLDKNGITPLAFSRMSKLNHHTIYKAYKGLPLKRPKVAKRLLKHCNNELTLSDVGEFKENI